MATFFLMYNVSSLLQYSPIRLAGMLVESVTHSSGIAALFVLVATYVFFFLVLRMLLSRRDAFERAAMHEERLFREGSEDWDLWQRTRSNLLFGAVHIFNMYIPLAAVIALSTAGWWFMHVYRKTYRQEGSRVAALQESAAVHAAHNKLLIYSLPIVVLGVVAYVMATH